jgi:hypothetical protein
MYLDTVTNVYTDFSQDHTKAGSPSSLGPWLDMQPSRIHHHERACCENAREWFLNMDFSLLAGSSLYTGPPWIRQRFDWGPSPHPIFWCDAVCRKELDCGALGALSLEAFKARGVEAYPLQLVQTYSKEANRHWQSKWKSKEISTRWLGNDDIYHEGCAIRLANNTVKLWDASAAAFLNADNRAGYGSILGLQISAPSQRFVKPFTWGRHDIQPNTWVELK